MAMTSEELQSRGKVLRKLCARFFDFLIFL